MALEVEPSDAGQRACTVRILAIDQGTSATKAVVFGEDGDIVTSVEAAVTPQAVPGGGVEQDPEQLWESVCEAGREAVARAGEGVTAVGFANQGETVLAWDRSTGRPLSTAISWQDRRAAAICADMAGVADDLTRTTGLPLDPYFAAPKMTWLRRNVTAEGVVTTSDAWLLHRLTGSYVTDVTTASRTLLLDLGTRTWSEEACAAFGLDAAELPEVVGSAQEIGRTDAFGPSLPMTRAQRRSAGGPGRGALPGARGVEVHLRHGGLPPGQCRAAARRVVRGPGRLGGLAARRRRPPTASTGRSMPPAPPSPGCSAGGSCDGPKSSMPSPARSPTAAACAWCRPSAAWAPRGGNPTPWPALTGIGPGTEPAHVVRSTVEGLAAQVTLLARAAAIDLGRPLALLRVDGGLTRSRVLMQMQADLLQVPVEVASSPHATAAGVGALARLGAGAGRTLDDVVRRDRARRPLRARDGRRRGRRAAGAVRARRGSPHPDPPPASP